MEMMLVPCLLLGAYLLGSIPFGLLLTRAAGLGDVRRIGSGNIGATNVLRTGHKGLAALTLLLDAAKGFVAVKFVWLVPLFGLPPPGIAEQLASWTGWMTLPSLLGLAAMLGHLYPVWLRFKGGKGVATYLGVVAALSPMVALAFVVSWLGVFKASRISSLSALIAAVTTCLASMAMTLVQQPWKVLEARLAWSATLANLLCLMIMSALIFHTHRANLRRLREGSEPRFGTARPSLDGSEEYPQETGA